MNLSPVGQAFLPAGSGGFPAPSWSGGLESPPNRQPGKAALRGSWPQCAVLEPLRLPMNRSGTSAPGLSLPARNEWGESRREGPPSTISTSSPRPSPPSCVGRRGRSHRPTRFRVRILRSKTSRCEPLNLAGWPPSVVGRSVAAFPFGAFWFSGLPAGETGSGRRLAHCLVTPLGRCSRWGGLSFRRRPGTRRLARSFH